MKKNIQIGSEINFIELFQLIWQGKWKIFVVVAIFYSTTFFYQANQIRNFTAVTEFRPVSILEIKKYHTFNNFISDIYNSSIENSEVNSSNLFNLYLDLLNDKLVFEDAMRKFNLLDPSQYNNEQEYNEEITKLATSVKILSPQVSKNNKKIGISHYTIQFQHNDVKKWKSILIYVDELSQKLVKKILVEEYKNTLSFMKQKQNYQLEDIEAQIVNAQLDHDKQMKKFELGREFRLEDIQTKITNILLDYDRTTLDRLAFLRENAAIARKLEIANNTIEAQVVSSENNFVTNVKIDTPYYLRGFEAIEKEIELIEMRNDKKAFIVGLHKLEQEKRALEQDRTSQRVEKNKKFLDSIIKLEKRQRAIKQNKTIDRIESTFQLTPLAESNKFSAASANIFATKFVYSSNKKQLALITVIGLIIGLFYVIISNVFQSDRASRKKT